MCPSGEITHQFVGSTWHGRARISWQRPRKGMEFSFRRAVWTQLERPGHCNMLPCPHIHTQTHIPNYTNIRSSPTAEGPEDENDL